MGLVRVELLKLRTTRRALIGWWASLIGLVSFATVGGVLGTAREEFADPSVLTDLLQAATLAALLSLLLGIIASTNEWRHGTVSSTFLVTPRRGRVVVAKLVASALVGVAFSLTAIALVLAIGAPALSARGAAVVLDGDFWPEAARVVAGAAVVGALGSALGALVQAQVPALIGALIWFLVAEPVFAAVLPALDVGGVADFLPARAIGGLDGTNSTGLEWWAGGLVGLGYVAAFGIAGAVRTRRRDVT